MNDNAKKWVEALRSGEYKQGRGQLCDMKGRFCCLGVACDLSGVGSWVAEPDNDRRDYCTASGVPVETFMPQEVMAWLGIAEEAEHRLVRANDNQAQSFSEIADLIEAEPVGLFEGSIARVS